MSSAFDYDDVDGYYRTMEEERTATLINNVRKYRYNLFVRGKHIKALMDDFCKGEEAQIDESFLSAVNDCLFSDSIEDILTHSSEHRFPLLYHFRNGEYDLSKYPAIKKVAEKIDRRLLNEVSSNVRSAQYDPSAMSLTLNKGLDVNTRDRDGNTLLHVIAGSNFNLDAVKHLVEECGAKPYLLNKEGQTPAEVGGVTAAEVQEYLNAKITNFQSTINQLITSTTRDARTGSKLWLKISLQQNFDQSELEMVLWALNKYFNKTEIKEILRSNNGYILKLMNMAELDLGNRPNVLKACYEIAKQELTEAHPNVVAVAVAVDAANREIEKNAGASFLTRLFRNAKHSRMLKAVENSKKQKNREVVDPQRPRAASYVAVGQQASRDGQQVLHCSDSSDEEQQQPEIHRSPIAPPARNRAARDQSQDKKAHTTASARPK
jgi:hypothetical protein